MKIKISPVLLCILSVLALVLVCFLVMPSEEADSHAGHDHATTAHDHATTATHNHKAAESYTFTKNEDGTYSYTVTARNGSTLLQEQNSTRLVEFTAVSDDVLEVSGLSGTGLSARWARFYNVQSCRVSPTRGGALGSGATQVACLEERTGQLHVFVYDQFDESVEPQVYTLEGLQRVEGVEPDVTWEQEGNALKVTYATEDGKKAVTVPLN